MSPLTYLKNETDATRVALIVVNRFQYNKKIVNAHKPKYERNLVIWIRFYHKSAQIKPPTLNCQQQSVSNCFFIQISKPIVIDLCPRSCQVEKNPQNFSIHFFIFFFWKIKFYFKLFFSIHSLLSKHFLVNDLPESCDRNIIKILFVCLFILKEKKFWKITWNFLKKGANFKISFF